MYDMIIDRSLYRSFFTKEEAEELKAKFSEVGAVIELQ